MISQNGNKWCKIFSGPLQCKRNKCLSTTPVCGIETDVNYASPQTDVIVTKSTEPGMDDAEGCKAFCKRTYPEAKYFSWFNPPHVEADKCFCRSDFNNKTNATGAESGAIYCDDTGKMIVTFRFVYVRLKRHSRVPNKAFPRQRESRGRDHPPLVTVMQLTLLFGSLIGDSGTEFIYHCMFSFVYLRFKSL